MADVTADEIRRRAGAELTDDEVAALADLCAAAWRAVANFPQEDLQRVEPPLRSTPGPRL